MPTKRKVPDGLFDGYYQAIARDKDGELRTVNCGVVFFQPGQIRFVRAQRVVRSGGAFDSAKKNHQIIGPARQEADLEAMRQHAESAATEKRDPKLPEADDVELDPKKNPDEIPPYEPPGSPTEDVVPAPGTRNTPVAQAIPSPLEPGRHLASTETIPAKPTAPDSLQVDTSPPIPAPNPSPLKGEVPMSPTPTLPTESPSTSTDAPMVNSEGEPIDNKTEQPVLKSDQEPTNSSPVLVDPAKSIQPEWPEPLPASDTSADPLFEKPALSGDTLAGGESSSSSLSGAETVDASTGLISSSSPGETSTSGTSTDPTLGSSLRSSEPAPVSDPAGAGLFSQPEPSTAPATTEPAPVSTGVVTTTTTTTEPLPAAEQSSAGEAPAGAKAVLAKAKKAPVQN